MNMDDRTRTGNDGGTGAWDAMARTFRGWEMPVPPVPEVFRPVLEARGEFCWATPAKSGGGGEMYRWMPGDAEPFFAGRGADYVAACHAGHGVNSYAIIYQLAYRGLVVFAEQGWGGFYMDKATTTAEVAGMLEGCRGLLAAWEAHGFDTDPESRMLCIYTGLGRGSSCGWVPADGLGPIESFRHAHDLGDDQDGPRAFAHALRLVETRAATRGRAGRGDGSDDAAPGPSRP